jgi:hypothetical protein
MISTFAFLYNLILGIFMKTDELIGKKFLSCRTIGEEVVSYVLITEVKRVHAVSENQSVIYTEHQSYLCNLDALSVVHEIALE